MLDHLPGADTPPQSRQRDTTTGDITRSDSYSLSRGGKLVSSRPWDTNGAHVLLSLHTSDIHGRPDGHKQPRRASGSSGSSSDSDSDSEGTSEDEYELSGGRHQAGLASRTVLEEPEFCHSQNTHHPDEEDEDDTSGQHCCSCDDICDNECRKQSGQCGHEEDDIESDSDDDDDDDDDGSESDETESTVRARHEAGNVTAEGGSSRAQRSGDEEHNDTLSTLSGDLSFDDRDMSPLREQEMAGGSESVSGLRRSPSPAPPSLSTTQECHTDSMTAEEVDGFAEGKCVAKVNDSHNLQWTGVRAGVFCLSGYPRQGEGATHSSSPDIAPSTRHSPASHAPVHLDDSREEGARIDKTEGRRECREARRGCGEVQTDEATSNRNHVEAPAHYDQSTALASTCVMPGRGWNSDSYGQWPGAAESSKDYYTDYVPSEHVRKSLQDQYKYKSGRVLRESPSRGGATPPPHSTQHGNTLSDNQVQPKPSPRQHKSVYLSDTNLLHDLHQQQQHQHQQEQHDYRQGGEMTGDASSFHRHQRNHHQPLKDHQEQEEDLTLDSPSLHLQHHQHQHYHHHQQHYNHHRHPRESPFQENERGRGPRTHLYSSQQEEEEEEEDPWSAPTPQQRPLPTVSRNTSEGGSRGSGCGSPALPHPVAPPAPPTSPMPRLLASTSGLSSSASRLSGGAAASCAALGSNRLAASYVALGGSSASSGYGSCSGAALASSRHEDSEDLSDVSSGATSEESNRRRRRRSAQSVKGEASVSGNEDFEWVRGSPMLTGLLEGQVTRLATPPDHRAHAIRSSLTTPPESGEESSLTPRPRPYPRPPPVPRPRTLEAGELVPHRPPRDPRDGLRDRLYSPIRDLSSHRRSRDSSVERSIRDSSCDRTSVSSLHHLHHHATPRLSHPCDCWCDDEEHGYDSCDERHHQHRHSYHEGLHRAHLHHLQPHTRHHHHHHQHQHQTSREPSRERRNRGHGSGDSGRSSPCCCRNQQLGSSLSSLASQDVCNSGRLALPCSSKGGGLEERVVRLEGDKDSLQLQVTVLGEQVEAQAEKITDLEAVLQEKREQLNKAEEQLQKEIMARTSLETQRLELFSELSNLKLRQAAYERENAELREKVRRLDHLPEHAKVQPVVGAGAGGGGGTRQPGSGRSVAPAAASTPVHSFLLTPDSPQPSHQVGGPLSNSPSPSSISTLSTIPASSPNKSGGQPTTASPASSPLAPHDTPETLPPRTPPPNARRKIDQFGTVPRGQREAENNHGGPASGAGRSKGVMFGKGFNFIPFRVAGKRSTSAPNLAETEMQMIDDVGEGEFGGQQDTVTSPPLPRSNTLTTHRSPPTNHKATGIKKIFTRLRRSSSGHLDGDLGDGDFRRGGMRATASARLGWTSSTTIFKEPSEMFSNWRVETMEAWLNTLGLSQYCPGMRSWSSSGRHLSKATPHQLERDLGVRHPLHRKKLQLVIAARLSGEQLNTPLHRLDHTWVLRWLDDVGLPQYKDAFSEARVDGRVLNCLTFDDLSFLRLTNLLHVTSLKRGIQVLREHNFDPSVLKRRSVPDEDQRTRTAAEVALWTNHRVMEWLRTVDLSEYAPNLRGSGVHGALMVYEVRFTSELLASLLSIPCGKTLLRRHLNTHFKELVGRTVVQEKRELEAASGYTPLTTSAKVKMPKKSQFSLKRKKSKSELDFEDLLCPMDEKPPVGAVQAREAETNGDGRLC